MGGNHAQCDRGPHRGSHLLACWALFMALPSLLCLGADSGLRARRDAYISRMTKRLSKHVALDPKKLLASSGTSVFVRGLSPKSLVNSMGMKWMGPERRRDVGRLSEFKSLGLRGKALKFRVASRDRERPNVWQVRICETGSVKDAAIYFLYEIGTYSLIPQHDPQWKGRSVGEVAIGFRFTNKPWVAVVFRRGNIVVAVTSGSGWAGERMPDANELAAAIDGSLLKRPGSQLAADRLASLRTIDIVFRDPAGKPAKKPAVRLVAKNEYRLSIEGAPTNAMGKEQRIYVEHGMVAEKSTDSLWIRFGAGGSHRVYGYHLGDKGEVLAWGTEVASVKP